MLKINKDKKDLLGILGSSMFTAIVYYLSNVPKTDFKVETAFSNLDEVLLYVPVFCILILPTTFLFLYQIFKKEEVVENGN